MDTLKKGFIRSSSSPLVTPILLVKRKMDQCTCAIDYRDLSKLMTKNKYPLPRVKDLFEQLGGGTLFHQA